MVPNILVCSADGHPQHWATWQDVTTLKFKGCIAWEYGENEYTFHGGISRMTGVQSTITIPSIAAVKSKFSRKRGSPALTSENLFRRDLHICGYCGRLCKGESATIDHIVPVSKGGQHIWTNTVCACKKCNGHKGNKSLKEADMELLYVPYTPNHEEVLILRNRNILADQMEFLSGFLPEHSRAFKLV